MNFYDYYETSEQIEHPCYLAAQSLVDAGFEVVALKEGTKEPINHASHKNLARLRQTPIRKEELQFFFAGQYTGEIAIMLRRNMEVLDIDDKAKPGIAKQFLNDLIQANLELYDKLVINKTPHNGLHIIYYSENIGGSSVLARVNASPHPQAIIERLNETNKSYIKCAPSKGYEFIKGNPLEMPTLTGEERNWLSAFATSYNKVSIPEVKEDEAAREDSPWAVFNAKHDYTYTLNELLERGWSVMMDLPDSIRLKRPAGVQLSASLFKDTNSLYLYTTSSDLKPETGYSPFGIYAHFYHDGNIALACRKLASEGIGVNIFDEGQFWKRQRNKIVVKYTDLMQWLHSVGYRVYENEIVKITDNIVSIIEERDLRAAFLNEIEPELVDYFYDKVGTIFSETGGVRSMLQKLENNFVTDTDTETWIFFKNYAIKITADEILPFQYKEITGYVWQSAIIDRNFHNEPYTGCDAERFVSILGGDKWNTLCELLGYSISRYKDPLNPRAIILTEDIDPNDEGEAQGGSGKGLLFSFIRQFRKVTDFDGKNFKLSDSFLYQNVDIDTNIMLIDDVPSKFRFDSLFSILTGSLQVNKKNKGQIIIPFERAPKVVITSNYAVGAMDISSQRRKYEFAVVKYFGAECEPFDVFGRMFFSGWDTKEWGKFDNFIAECCKMYLGEKNKKAMNNVTINSIERSLIANTNKEFIDYMDSLLLSDFYDYAPDALKVNGVMNYDLWLQNMTSAMPNNNLYIIIDKDKLFDKVNSITKTKGLTPTRLTKWVKRWATSRNVTLDTRYLYRNDRVNLLLDYPRKKTENDVNEVPF